MTLVNIRPEMSLKAGYSHNDMKNMRSYHGPFEIPSCQLLVDVQLSRLARIACPLVCYSCELFHIRLNKDLHQ
jgi:hypothetical protein